MNTQFKKGLVEICVLKIISKKDMYGFEIIEKLRDDLDINENTVYPLLRRLTTQGLFETYNVESEIGPRRKYYKITEEGLNQLSNYLTEWNLFLSKVNNILEEKNE